MLEQIVTLTTLVGTPVEELDTPALIVDLDVLDANISVMTGLLAETGVSWRPHAKAHKSPAVAHRLLAAGAIGITCAKLAEAEVYAASGIRDILIANQVVGPLKARRLAELATEIDIMSAVDSIEGATFLSEAAVTAGSQPRVLIEVDTGMARGGVTPGEPTVELAKQIVQLPNLRFAGIMSWEGHVLSIEDGSSREAAIRTAVGDLLTTADAIRAAGIPVEIVSCGGTGTIVTTRQLPGVTEVQAGGGIFGDAFYRMLDVPLEPALFVKVTVTSRPTSNRILFDAGRKTMDPSNVAPEVVGLDNVESISLSAEHGTIRLNEPNDTVKVGDTLTLRVGYSDQAVHLHEQLLATRDGKVVAIWPTLARGKLT
jgi:D-serine deaminase-like pyridoxal phosphate-dependent protein